MRLLQNNKTSKIIKIGSIVLFLGCVFFLIYYLILQPYYSKKVTEKYRDIYYSSEEDSSTVSISNEEGETTQVALALDNTYKNNAKDENGILLKFSKLLEFNSDIKGWLSIPGTNIDYPVMQDFNGGDFYLTRDFEGNKDKNGSLYIDGNCNVETPTKNIVIHGHNMKTTEMMFFELPNYGDIDFYKEHPVITFDSIYENAQWKIISYMRVAGITSRNDNFDYMTGTFENDEKFLDFLYDIEVRSLYYCPVDVNEDDTLLMLSTCSYEVNDYRTVVVARKVRDGESVDVDTDHAYLRGDVLYTDAYYKVYGGEKPVTTNFQDAYNWNEIKWYDGNAKRTNPVGTVHEVNKLKYEITSASTVKFVGCSNIDIKELEIPDSVEINDREYAITDYSKTSFEKLTKLKELKIGDNITKIHHSSFVKCEKLESVTLGDCIETIEKKSFYNLENLSKIVIQSTKLENVGKKAFTGISTKSVIKLPKDKFDKYKKLIEQSNTTDHITYKKIS